MTRPSACLVIALIGALIITRHSPRENSLRDGRMIGEPQGAPGERLGAGVPVVSDHRHKEVLDRNALVALLGDPFPTRPGFHFHLGGRGGFFLISELA